MRMQQEACDQSGYQLALQEFQKFDDMCTRTITLMVTLEVMAATARFVEWLQMFQVPDG